MLEEKVLMVVNAFFHKNYCAKTYFCLKFGLKSWLPPFLLKSHEFMLFLTIKHVDVLWQALCKFHSWPLRSHTFKSLLIYFASGIVNSWTKQKYILKKFVLNLKHFFIDVVHTSTTDC